MSTPFILTQSTLSVEFQGEYVSPPLLLLTTISVKVRGVESLLIFMMLGFFSEQS